MNMKVKKKKGKLGAVEVKESKSLDTLINQDEFQPEHFLSANDRIANRSLKFLKELYDFAKSCENPDSIDDPLGLHTNSLKKRLQVTKTDKKKKKRGGISVAEAPLRSLVVEDFDEDQVWEELELQNGLIYDNLVTSISRLLTVKENDKGEEEQEVTSDLEGDGEVVGELGEDGDESGDSEDDEDNPFLEDKPKKRADSRKYAKSVVDDKFFNLAQMTEHIERLENEGDGKEQDSEEDDDDSVDLFEDVPSEEDEEKKEAQLFYQDFFDPPLKDEEPVNDEEESEEVEDAQIDAPKKVHFNLEPEEDEDAEGLEDSDEDDEKPADSLAKKINQTLSSFERRKKTIEASIEDLENEALAPKSWQLLGESTGQTRPENALLEEHLHYDHLIRPAPEVTVETTLKLEDIIRQRIKDAAWDDVLRKVRPIEDPREYKKRLVLDAEKSKASLAEIYEQEYLEKKRSEEGETEEKEPEEHTVIRNELSNLFQKLDALTHFHFTPKQPKADVKVISNVPSISIEETAGVSVSDANMLAPQEIQDRAKGPIKGSEERSSTDMKRERRKKKKKQHLKRLQREDVSRQKGLGLSNIKLAEGIVKAQQKKMKEADSTSTSGDFRYSTSNQSRKELKSSKAFFSKLQQTVTSHIDKVSKRKTDDKPKSNLSAKKFKL